MQSIELAQAILNSDAASKFAFDFAVSIESQLNRGYQLSDKQTALLTKLHNETCNKPEAAGNHVGNVGDKLTALQVTLTSLRDFNSAYGTGKAASYADASGNVYVWLTGSPINGNVGDVLTINATIKAHTEFRGQKQTSLSRVKVINVAVAA